jgi:trk system potassium uptake protein TrkH
VIYGFLLLLGLGTGLLLLPFSTAQGLVPPFLTAMFTAASAITVTGLTVEDTATFWSPVGQAVILALIIIGGMGWMTLAGFLLVVLGQRITLPQRLALREPLGQARIGGVIRVLRSMILTFLGLQAVGGVLLAMRLRETRGWEWPQALWQGLFQAVAAFNNSGFAILPDSASLSFLSKDAIALGIIGGLIILGGLSYPVLADLVRTRRFARFSLDTKIVLVGSVLLWLMGTLVVFAFEYNTPETLGPMGFQEKLLNAAFLSVSSRTAGFSTMNIGALAASTAFFIMALMAIGTASASTGGGIRLNTMGVLIASVWVTLRGQGHVTAFGREIPADQVQRAITVAMLAVGFVFLVAFVLTLADPGKLFIDLLFETISAFGTVGLSLGVTPELSTFGKLLIILAMALGRAGPLMLALALASREQRAPLYRNIQERVKIG